MLKTIVEPPTLPQITPTPPGPNLPYTMINTPPNIVSPPPTNSGTSENPPAQNSLIHNKSFVFGVVGVLVLAVGIGAAVLLSSQSQDSRKQAAVQGGPVQISITPTEKSIGVGETSTFTTFINTQGRVISGISVRLSYSFTGSAPLMTASNPTPLIQQTNTSWSCAIAKTTVAEGRVNIDLGCTSSDTAGYSNSTNTPLFSVSMTAGQTATTSPITLAFDPTLTIVVDKQTGEDIAAIPSSSAVITITGAVATATPSPSPTQPAATSTPSPTAPTSATATPSPTGQPPAATATPSPTRPATTTPSPTGLAATTTPTPSRTPTPTIGSSTTTYSCNHTCSANRDCQSNMACLNGYCRDPRCPTDTTCQCQNRNVASESGASTLPETGGAPYSIWLSILGGLLIFSSINFAILLKKQT